jgi:hypothetical protein
LRPYHEEIPYAEEEKKKKHFFRLVFTTVSAVVFILCPALVQADDITSSTELSLQISSLPEAKLSLTQSFTFPFLQGSGPLTSGNNIKTDITAEVTPVSMAAMANVIFTPIAFLEFNVGGKLGSGWNMVLGNGIGLNVPVGDTPGLGTPRKFNIDGSPFDGLQWRAWVGGAFQFDLAAVVPGDWNHILVRAYNEFRYSAYTRAGTREPWIIENDRAENLNGWTYHLTTVLGYQMPLSPVLNFVGFMGEADFNLYDDPGMKTWGGDLPNWTVSAFFNFAITPNFGTTLIAQMITRRNYGDSDFGNENELYYRDRVIQDNGGSQRLLFYRMALIFTYKLR